jgi:ABC-type dipeptide/oligopeptide/nickel transport system ATPase component
MRLLRELNESEGTTFLVVTHDPSVARQTKRVLVMADGRIVREDRIGSPIEEDLKMWRHSGLGRRIVNKDIDDLEGIPITSRQLNVVKKLLEDANEKHDYGRDSL